MIARRLTLASALAAAASLVAGCSVLFPGLDPFWADPGPFPEPTTLSNFVKGTATIELTRGGETLTYTLDKVDAGSSFDSFMGAMVTWRNDDGWIIQVNAYDPSMLGMGTGPTMGDLTIQRIDGHEFWMAGSYVELSNRCIVDVWELSPDTVSGRATCHTVRWVDGTAPWGMNGPAYVDGEDPFDLVVTFEAHPATSQSVS